MQLKEDLSKLDEIEVAMTVATVSISLPFISNCNSSIKNSLYNSPQGLRMFSTCFYVYLMVLRWHLHSPHNWNWVNPKIGYQSIAKHGIKANRRLGKFIQLFGTVNGIDGRHSLHQLSTPTYNYFQWLKGYIFCCCCHCCSYIIIIVQLWQTPYFFSP